MLWLEHIYVAYVIRFQGKIVADDLYFHNEFTAPKYHEMQYLVSGHHRVI